MTMTIRKLSALAALLGPLFCGTGCGGGGGSTPGVDAYNTPGYLTRYAGTGINGLGGNGLPPAQTDLSLPMDITIASDGTAYIADWNNHRIRKVAGGVTQSIVGSIGIGDATPGLGTEMHLNHPTHIIVEADGNLIYTAWHNSKIQRYITATGMVENIAGTGGRGFGGDNGPAVSAVLDLPAAAAFKKGGGGFYFMDQANQIIRFVDTSGGVVSNYTISTYAGTQRVTGYEGDGGQAAAAKMHQPVGQSAPPGGRLVVDANGDIVFADSGNHVIRKIDTTTGVITTIAGTGTPGYSGDGGPATAAMLNRPTDIAIDMSGTHGDGDIYIADTDNHCIRKLDHHGEISTVAGSGGNFGYAGEGRKGEEALLNRPHGVETDADGNLYIVDTYNNRILRLKK